MINAVETAGVPSSGIQTSDFRIDPVYDTINYQLMTDARQVAKGDHSLFVCGNDAAAKNQLKHFLVDNFYWKAEGLVDLGSMESARALEAIVPFCVLLS